ncbi:unnamed protein product, partial [Pleuronectes platessa]
MSYLGGKIEQERESIARFHLIEFDSSLGFSSFVPPSLGSRRHRLDKTRPSDVSLRHVSRSHQRGLVTDALSRRYAASRQSMEETEMSAPGTAAQHRASVLWMSAETNPDDVAIPPPSPDLYESLVKSAAFFNAQEASIGESVQTERAVGRGVGGTHREWIVSSALKGANGR